MKIAAIVRGLGWTLAAITLAIGGYGMAHAEGEEALSLMRAVAVSLAVLIGITQAVAWCIEKHAERVVVR